MSDNAPPLTVRILHTGDLHLDSPFSGLSVKKSAERRAELRRTFSRLMELVRERHIDLVLMAGDVFDAAYVTGATAAFLMEEIAACPDCRFIVAPGNHDPYTHDSIWASSRLPENLLVFSHEELAAFVFPHWQTAVYGWAFLSDSLTVSPLSGHTAEDPTRLNLICGHCDLGVPLSKYGPVSEADLAAFGAQYAAFAHRHIPEEPTPVGRGLCAYCGCLEGRSFDEPGRGGVYVLEAVRQENGWEIATERVELSHRRYEIAHIDLTGVSQQREVARRIKAVVEQNGYGEETALRIVFTGSTPPDFAVPTQADGSTLGLYSLEIVDRTAPTFDARYLEKDMTVRGELYRSLLPRLSEGTPEERATAARALRMGIAALEGNDIANL